MKRKIARLLVLSTLILSFYGCASGKADQTYPSYFEPVIQELTTGWTDYREGHPTSGLMDVFCDGGMFNGGREENGLFISYIEYEKDTEPKFVFFRLKELLTDAEADEWDWASAGAFLDEEQGKTYLCYYDFNDLTNAGERDPQLILVEFDTEDPENYQATPYAVEPRNIFSWYCEGYRIGDDLYIAGQEELGAIDLNTKEFRYCREEKSWAEEYAQKVYGEGSYYLRAFRGILEQDDVTVYSAEVAEAIDVPAVGMVFVAVRGNQPIAYMSVDLTAEDITQGVKTATAE